MGNRREGGCDGEGGRRALRLASHFLLPQEISQKPILSVEIHVESFAKDTVKKRQITQR